MRLKQLNTILAEWAEFDDAYFVGDDGHIYRRMKSGWYRSKMHPYQQVRNTFGTGKQHTVHCAVACALAFVPRKEGATDIDHINNDKTDNRAVNLQWLTHRENLQKKSKDKAKGA